jgi:LemA protein
VVVWIIAGAVLIVLAILVVVAYNSLIAKRNRTVNAWAQVDVQLRRRYDLIPNLVASVKAYAAHEQQTFAAVTEARAAAQRAQGPLAQSQAEAALSGALRGLLAVAEAYPALRATENFQALQAELAGTENRTAVARQVYNDSVLTYNNACQQVPTNIVAGLFGFATRDPFVVYDVAREPAAVNL